MRAAGGLRGPALRGRPRRGARRAAQAPARDPPRGRQARRQLLGRGQRALPLPGGRRSAAPCATRLADLAFAVAGGDARRATSRKFAEMGGIVEEFLEYPGVRLAVACSCASTRRARSCCSRRTTRSSAARRARSTRAAGSRRTSPTGAQIQEAARRVGDVLARRGVVSRFGVDFFVGRRPGGEPGGLRPRDQPAHGRHDASLPRAAVPDGRQARPRVRRLPLAGRPSRSSTARPTT